MVRAVRLISVVAGLAVAASIAARVRGAEATGEWRAYAADKASSRYSPLDQINRNTVTNLRLAWRQSVVPLELRQGHPDLQVPSVSQNTPVMVDGLLYVSTAIGAVAALDPASGKVVWSDGTAS